MSLLPRWLRAVIAHRYLLEVRDEHLARFPQLACMTFDHVAAAINVHGRFDKEELEFLTATFADRIAGRTVCDVGAYIGNHSLAFAERAGRVIALEPQALAFELLNLNCRARPNVVCLRLGASDRRAVLDAAAPPRNLGGNRIASEPPDGFTVSSRIEVVPLSEIPELADSDLGLVKIDVEGHEEQVLRGAAPLLQAQRPLIVLEQQAEAISAGTSPSVELLKRYGYGHFYSLEGRHDWHSPDWLPRPVRRVVRAIEAALLGLPPRRVEARPLERLERRDYPLLLASAEPLRFGSSS